MKVALRVEAKVQAAARRAWWVANRPAAPDAFDEEIARALDDPAERATTFPVLLRHRGAEIRRILLPKVRCHLYYAVDDRREVVDVFAVWGAAMGRLPALAKAGR